MHRIAPLLVTMLLSASLATAQNPAEPTVEVEIGSSETGASIDQPATYDVTIRNTSPGSGSGSDPTMQVTLVLSGAPPGWQASLEQASFQIPPGGSATTTLSVAVTGSASDDSATITVEATIRSGAFAPFEATGTGSDSVEVLREDSTSREIAEFVSDYLWYIVVGGIILYVGSTVLMALLFRKREQQKQQKAKAKRP